MFCSFKQTKNDSKYLFLNIGLNLFYKILNFETITQINSYNIWLSFFSPYYCYMRSCYHLRYLRFERKDNGMRHFIFCRDYNKY